MVVLHALILLRHELAWIDNLLKSADNWLTFSIWLWLFNDKFLTLSLNIASILSGCNL